MKIYTKTGDEGMTSLYGGKRISKAELQIETYGNLDELIVDIGFLRSQPQLAEKEEFIREIQEILFSIGSYLASDFDKKQLFKPSLDANDISVLENEIDWMEKDLEPMKYFVLPGGSVASSLVHVARVHCRKCERLIVAFYSQLENDLPEKTFILSYLNRLSDYLFVLSRWVIKKEEKEEYFWIPKKK
jgi:cob(I)alamin adenosyltransferase